MALCISPLLTAVHSHFELGCLICASGNTAVATFKVMNHNYIHAVCNTLIVTHNSLIHVDLRLKCDLLFTRPNATNYWIQLDSIGFKVDELSFFSLNPFIKLTSF